MKPKIRLRLGDITKFDVDAIVNAANKSLLGGGGVDGAIHRAAGPILRKVTATLEGCSTGSAKLTEGFDLPAKYIIHTVGPVWQGGNAGEEGILKSCYRSCFSIANEQKFGSIAFPSIGTGAFGFPIESASTIALQEAAHFSNQYNNDMEMFFVCFSESDYRVYQDALWNLSFQNLV